MIVYPYANMGDSFMQEIIEEWHPPDAKKISHLLIFFVPILICSLSFVASEKKIKGLDLLVFLFFAYMLFRSVRFSIVFSIAASFFFFDYAITRKIPHATNEAGGRRMFIFTCVLLAIASLFLGGKTFNTWRSGKLISEILDKEFVEFVKKQQPKRLYNDYDFGEILIFNGIETFADARADLFSPHNLKDMVSLFRLVQTDPRAKEKFLNIQNLIDKYNFDAFLLRTNSSLASFLRTQPEKYQIQKETSRAIYFSRVPESYSSGDKQK